jgi:hypothetical protein
MVQEALNHRRLFDQRDQPEAPAIPSTLLGMALSIVAVRPGSRRP